LGFGLQSWLFGACESMLRGAAAVRAGGAAAIGETSYQLGAGMGIALLGSVMNAAYTPGLSKLPEAGIPAAARAAAAHSLGEAYQVADRLGGPLGAVLRSTARHSFVTGLHVTLLVSAALLLAGAFAALRLPRVMDCPAPALDDPGPADADQAREHRTPHELPAQRTLPRPARRRPAEATGSGRAAH
ncbi:MFS transporter, partial [Streptomyces sp. NPDC088135]